MQALDALPAISPCARGGADLMFDGESDGQDTESGGGSRYGIFERWKTAHTEPLGARTEAVLASGAITLPETSPLQFG